MRRSKVFPLHRGDVASCAGRETLHIAADAEGAALAAQEYRADLRIILRAPQRIEQRLAQLRAEGVAALGPVQSDGQKPAVQILG